MIEVVAVNGQTGRFEMSGKELVRRIEHRAAFIARWIFYISSVATVVGYLSRPFRWGNAGPFAYLKSHSQVLWLSALTAAAVILLLWVLRLHRRFVSGFSDDFKGDLRANWDFEGLWRIVEKGTLLVTGPEEERDTGGGITKVGALWENYAFTFRARILKECLGVVVRAQDLDNYYMFQIQTDKIRPHRRVAVPVVEPETASRTLAGEHMVPIKFKIGWQFFDPPTPLNHRLDDWFSVRVLVRGQAVWIYIDDSLVFQRESFLQTPRGKVGFRNVHTEEALVRDVRIVLEP